MKHTHPKSIKHMVIDVDGILTDGSFVYNLKGEKVYKTFGPDDNDALSLISQSVSITFVSADYRGFSISKSRVESMGYEIYNISSKERLSWIEDRFNLMDTCYIGDGFFDARILNKCGYSISTSSSAFAAKLSSNYITPSTGGQRALSEAILHLCVIYFPNLFRQYCSICCLNDEQSRLLIAHLTKQSFS